MMKKLYATLALLCVSTLLLHAQPLNFQWATPAMAEGFDIATDAAGNVYTTGYFNGTTDFDPGPGSVLLSGTTDVFIVKSTNSGALIWAKKLAGTTAADRGISIAADANGDVVVTGWFKGTVDFDPGPSTYSLSSFAASNDVFVLKLDSSGNFIWAAQLGGTGNDAAVSAVHDGAGNVLVTGNFQGTADFDPGSGTVNLTTPSKGIFICKLDVSGGLLWVESLDGPGDKGISDLVTDAAGNIYSTGYFTSTLDMDPGSGVASLTTPAGAVFISKLDAAGAYIWGKQITGTDGVYGKSISVDPWGGVVITGSLHDSADFDPGAGTYILHTLPGGLGYPEGFVSKLDATGNFAWAKVFGEVPPVTMGALFDPYCVVTDAVGSVYVTGYVWGTLDMDPGPGLDTMMSPYDYDIVLLKLSSSGSYMGASHWGGEWTDIAKSIALDASGNIFLTGEYEFDADFDPSAASYIMDASTQGRMFTTKLSQPTCPNFSLTVDTVDYINCSNLQGYIGVHASGGAMPYTYTWNTTPAVTDSFLLPTAPGIYGITVTDTAGCAATANVLMNGAGYVGAFDLNVNAIHENFRPGYGKWLWLDAFNDGCAPTSGTLRLVKPSLMTALIVYPTPTTVSGDTMTWNFTNLTFDAPLPWRGVRLYTPLTYSIGDTVCFTVMIDPITGDADTTNNVKELCYPITNSWDPNDIAVSPRGACDEGYVLPGTTLTYTVRFQNSGNDTAFNIHVLDSLDSDLNISTVKIMGSSHPMITEVLAGNVLKFNFDNINLPDSNVNEPLSHGYIVYEIDHNSTVTNGTEMENSAAIYFDFNPAVLTNTVKNTIVTTIPSCTPLSVDLLSFNGRVIGSAVQLNWQVGTEKNITSYSVERSLNGKNFTAVGNVVATGSKVYQFNDDNLGDAAVAYYRLRINEISGRHDLSNVIHFNFHQKGNTVNVYPNPATGTVNISSAAAWQNASMKLTNAMGQVVMEKHELNGNNFTIDLSTLTKGIYMLEVGTVTGTERIKISKQ